MFNWFNKSYTLFVSYSLTNSKGLGFGNSTMTLSNKKITYADIEKMHQLIKKKLVLMVWLYCTTNSCNTTYYTIKEY